MNHIDFYSGEPLSGSPDINQNYQDQNYCYDPNQRFMQQQSKNMYYPGQMGYNNPYGYNPQQQFGYRINVNQMYPNFYQQPNFMNNYGYSNPVVGNPALSMIQNNPALMNNNPYFMQYQQQSYEDKNVFVPGFNTGSDMMLTNDAQEVCDNLQIQMMMEQEEALVKRNERFQGYFNNNYGGYNYYGMPYMMTNYMDRTVEMKYRNIINDMKQQAVERRLNFNKRLSKLVHNYLDDDISDQDIDQIYDGYSYTVPGLKIKQSADQDRLSRMVPVSNQQMYVNHFNNVQNEFNLVVNQGDNMNEFLNDCGCLRIYYNMEEEYHRRRDATGYYQPDAYKKFLRRSIRDRLNVNNNVPNENIPLGNQFPTLNESAKMLDDGTISITPPDWIMNNHSYQQPNLVINNELEQNFEENRNRFLQSIYNLK